MLPYEITNDARRFDIAAIHALLSRSYWSSGVPKAVVARAIANSLCFGALHDGKQVGFARVVTDRAIRIVPSLCAVLLAACASTNVTLSPSPQEPVCDRSAAALVLWAPQWRPDQKDVVDREAAAASGLGSFFASSGCFARTDLRRVQSLSPAAVMAELGAPADRFNAVVTIAVRELGPVVKLLSSASLVEGGTEVVLQVTSRQPQEPNPPREFAIHWRHGGPGVVKGVASLPGDMSAALRSGLQPATATQ